MRKRESWFFTLAVFIAGLVYPNREPKKPDPTDFITSQNWIKPAEPIFCSLSHESGASTARAVVLGLSKRGLKLSVPQAFPSSGSLKIGLEKMGFAGSIVGIETSAALLKSMRLLLPFTQSDYADLMKEPSLQIYVQFDSVIPQTYPLLLERVLGDKLLKLVPTEKNLRTLFSSVMMNLLKVRRMRFKIAETDKEKEDAYRLVYREYVKMGFLPEDPSGIFTSVYQNLPRSTTFVGVLDGEVVMTLTTVPDSEAGLPMDKLYSDVLRPLRAEGKKLVEYTMLATKKHLFGKGAHSLRDLRKMAGLFMLIRIAAQHSFFVNRDTDGVISVNPIYEKLYRYLDFKPIGGLRHYKEFADNPAIAMRLDYHWWRPCLKNFFINKRLPEKALQKNKPLNGSPAR